MDVVELDTRLARIEEQNARILILLEEIAAASIAYKGRRLPAQPPDFPAVEEALSRALAEPEAAAAFALEGFEAKTWLCEVRLRHDAMTRERWAVLEGVVGAVAAATGLPGRVAGHYLDPSDTQRIVGHTLQFGYSKEVGYDHGNEFYGELPK